MKKMNKKLANSLKLFDPQSTYSLEEAIELAKTTSYSKFDGSVDLNFKLNLNTRKADQQLRGSVSLPNGNGKSVRVLVASDKESVREEARKAGADIVTDRSELEEHLNKDKYDFDLIVVEPAMMTVLGKYGKKLGPKGLMPNPKTGTVTTQVAQAVVSIKKGKANFRADRGGCVHTLIGKCSMKTEALIENARVVISTLKRLKPAGVKGVYMQKLYVSASMGPGIKIKVE